MKTKISNIISLSLLMALIAAMVPAPVYAAPAITSVTPSQIVNNVDTTITITGSGFDSTAEVSLGGSIPLLRLTQSSTELTALVPAGTAAGSYAVTITMGADTATCASPCVTIVIPTPIPPTPTSASAPFARPQFVVRSSSIKGDVKTGANVTLKVVVENVGQATAYGAQAVYTSADLTPTKTGGLVALGTVAYDDEADVNQTFYVSAQLYGAVVIVVDLTMTYYDEKGASYSDKFTLSIPVSAGAVYSGSAAATSTPTSVKSSQLVITGYSADVDPLQPGQQFKLKLTIQNVGNANAQRITMIVGGGSSGGGSLTPQPGGVSAGGGDFANFAPVGASNVQSLGDLKAGDTIQAVQNLIVNVSTNPGAYPMKVTFSYLNDKNEIINDEQVITLLVYSLPNVNVSFYRTPDPFFAGQTGMLPIQVVNVGKRLAVFGDIKIETEEGTVENGTSLVGSLDAGGYFTLDAMMTPGQPGTVLLDITIDYIDDFNQPRTIKKKLEVEVSEAPVEEFVDPSMNGGGGGGEFPVEEETTLHKFFRFIKGLFGLDSAWPVWQPPGGGGGGMEETAPVQVVPGKGG